MPTTPNSRPLHFDLELSLALVRQQLFHHRRHARESLLQIMHVKMMNVRVAMKTPNSGPMTFLQLAPAYHLDVELSLALVRQQLFDHRGNARESLLQIMHVKMMNVRVAMKTPNSGPMPFLQLAPAYHCQRLGLQFPSMFALQLQPPTFRPLALHTQWYLKPLAFGIRRLAAASTPRI
jgi:hypothetical protein